MRSKGWVGVSNFILTLTFVFLTSSSVWAQTSDGGGDLDKAFDEKIQAKSTKDLDSVAKLCQSAIDKGLTKEEELQAKQLAASALFEHAEQLSRRILAPKGRDKRWRILRSQALSRLRKSVKYDPEFVDAFIMIAQLNSMEGGKSDDALEAIDKAIELADDDRRQKSRALYLRAILRDDETEQLEDLDQAIEVNPENMKAVQLRAAYYIRMRQPAKAIPDLNAWLDSDPTNSKNHVNVVRDLMRLGAAFDGDLQTEALKIIDKAIENAPDDADPLTIRAQIKILQEDNEGAIEDAGKALKVDPRNYPALILRASLLSDENRLDEALEDVNVILEDNPQAENAVRLRGRILSQQGKFVEAIEDYKLLANRGQAGQGYRRQLAMLYNANDEPSKAVRIFNTLLRESASLNLSNVPPNNRSILLLQRMSAFRGRGDARLSLGEHKGAVSDYEKALELAEEIKEIRDENDLSEIPVDDGVLNNLAWVLATSPKDDVRDGQRAIELATQAAEVTEFKEPHIMSTLASAYAETDDFEKAIEWIEKAIELNKELADDPETDKERNLTQKESLQKEYKSYQEKKPWRELQNVEEEKKEKEAEAKKEKMKDEASEDSDEEDQKKDADESDDEGDAEGSSESDDAKDEKIDEEKEEKDGEKE